MFRQRHALATRAGGFGGLGPLRHRPGARESKDVPQSDLLRQAMARTRGNRGSPPQERPHSLPREPAPGGATPRYCAVDEALPVGRDKMATRPSIAAGGRRPTGR